MPDQKISELTAVVTPASTDEFPVNQGGTSKKETRAQIHELQTGELLTGANAAGPAVANEAASATNPTLIPDKSDLDTGVGHRTTDVGVLIAGGQNAIEFGEAAAAPLVGFYGTAAIAQQTGVTVDAAGIHAALVALGLITA